MTELIVLSGFLGAGKTTFANKILGYYMAKGVKPAYIVNEFGQEVLDRKTIEAAGFTAVEMPGGCICCNLKDDVASAIQEVMDTFSPDVIVFEPSGIFIFDNFIEMVKAEPLRGRSRLGNVITIVDGVNFSTAKAKYGSFMYNQIKNAQILIISKIGRMTQPLDEIICDLGNINPTAKIIAQEINAEVFDEITSYSADNTPTFPDKHIHKFQTRTIQIPPLTASDVMEIIEKQRRRHYGDVYRIKGIINVDGKLQLLNIALDDVHMEPFKGYAETSLTFIGSNITFEYEAIQGL
ncbi:MAG: hypothetical protein FWE11_01560 [Defluviitaleaceae bacterium]|nr:hypothetical protein [Defluviitaleaceae bacterium]